MDNHSNNSIEVLYNFLIELFRFPSLKLLDAAVSFQNLSENQQFTINPSFNQFIEFLFDSQPQLIEETYCRAQHTQNIALFTQHAMEYEIACCIKNQSIENLCIPQRFSSFQAYLYHKKSCLAKNEISFLECFIIPLLVLIKDMFVSENRPVKNFISGRQPAKRYHQHTTNPYQHAFLALHESVVNLTRPQASVSEIPEAFTLNPLVISTRSHRNYFQGWICQN